MKQKKNIKHIPFIKYKFAYFALSILMIIVSAYSIFAYGLLFGVEFSGGSVVAISSTTPVTVDMFDGIDIASIQSSENVYFIKTSETNEEVKETVVSQVKQVNQDANLISFQTVGPSVGAELVKKTFYAAAIASVLILAWVAYQFKSPTFGVSAILAMLHDSFILIGSFALLGHLYGAEVDFLFVTAVLTTLSFSVHDTIVVFDRIREIQRGSWNINTIVDQAVTETMRRSIINSLTIIFMLLSLVILGGESIRWFATALLIGAVLGTYSSPFVAVPLLHSLLTFKKK